MYNQQAAREIAGRATNRFCVASSFRCVSICGFLPAESQILIRTASFLQKFTVSENSLCMLFANDARRDIIFF